ncbi:MAG: 2-C-methyl-D-erythritol 4-phosphate cytidylyltransferase [Dehalococcoidia bacterium]|nr:2-C-methyl-D-erythritol 4-phosphate cytidylyltransferase [Dehalococcoidia bacterium]
MGGIDKLLTPLSGRPLIAHSIAAFAGHPGIDEVVVVVSEANRAEIEAIVREVAPEGRVALGGARRRDSVLAGLEVVESEYVLVHDAARPLVSAEMIAATLAGARQTGAALCAVPVSDTVKRVQEDGIVRSTVAREGLWLAQTPQGFRTELLRRAHAATDIEATDDAALVELLGEPLRVVMGSARNLKVTTREDLSLAAALLAAGES